MRSPDQSKSAFRQAGALMLWSFALCVLLVWIRTGRVSPDALRKYAITAFIVALMFFLFLRRAAIEADPDDVRNYFPTALEKLDDVMLPVMLIVGPLLLLLVGSLRWPW